MEIYNNNFAQLTDDWGDESLDNLVNVFSDFIENYWKNNHKPLNCLITQEMLFLSGLDKKPNKNNEILNKIINLLNQCGDLCWEHGNLYFNQEETNITEDDVLHVYENVYHLVEDQEKSVDVIANMIRDRLEKKKG